MRDRRDGRAFVALPLWPQALSVRGRSGARPRRRSWTPLPARFVLASDVEPLAIACGVAGSEKATPSVGTSFSA